MKYTLSIILLFFATIASAQQGIKEQKIATKIKAVQVFTQKAEITREVSVTIPKGKSRIIFHGLSPEIDGGSIRLDGKGFTILSVKSQAEIPNIDAKAQEQQPLLEKRNKLVEEIKAEKARLENIQQTRKILLANQSIKGDANLTVMELRSAMEFFREQLDKNTEEEIKQKALISKKQEEHQTTKDQIMALGLQKVKKLGNIIALIEAETALTTKFTLSYVVSNARWLPSYDIRFNNIDEPLAISYKANIQQSTGIDWKNVQLSISSGNPADGGQAPSLTTWRLGYNTRYTATQVGDITEVSGMIYDAADGSPLPGVNVLITGSTIGTVTDIDGRYNLSIPSSASKLTYSYIGFIEETRNITSNIINVGMNADSRMLDEVVVVGRGRQKRKMEKSQITPLSSMSASLQQQSNVLATSTQEYQTNFAYEIETPYTIPSDNQSYAVEMVRHEVPSTYRYTTSPKILEKAFLTAEITNWGKYNLLEGEANLFFENSFVGKSVLQLKDASDTLAISLGRDERILVKREKEESLKEKKFIGTKRKESIGWNITVRNTKSKPIEITVVDHIPVSTYEDIKVELEKKGKATLDESTGILVWRLKLQPNTSQTHSFIYSVTYPKNRVVYLE